MSWRVGGKVPLNVYENDKPMFQCHTPEDAARIVALLNSADTARAALKQFQAAFAASDDCECYRINDGGSCMYCMAREALEARVIK